MQAIQKLGQPTNCRSLETLNVAVATPLYGGPESKASLFDGGLNLHVEGQAGGKSARDVPSFDPKLPLTVRMAFLNGQKVASGTLPFRAMIPTEEWVLLLDFNDSRPAWLCFGFDIQLHPAVAPPYAWPGRDA